MIVTKIEPVNRTRLRIYVDGERVFTLYKGEVSRFCLKEGEEITSACCKEIREEILSKRAKQRAMHLLKDMDRTETQLKEKLRQGEYPEDIIEQAVDYVKAFGYVDDTAYAQRFVDSQRMKKSRREISASLSRRGIGRELIEHALMDGYQEDDPAAAITAILKKKNYDPSSATGDEKQKLLRMLARKGFQYEDIRQVIQVSEHDA